MITDTEFVQWQHAATIIADAWEPYGQLREQAGYQTGYWAGYDAGEKATHNLYQTWLGVARTHLTNTRPYAELQAARAHTNQPCPAACGACSRCIRSAAAARNIARYGTPDYPGARQ